jgi:uncharacterized lipoprotein YajG
VEGTVAAGRGKTRERWIALLLLGPLVGACRLAPMEVRIAPTLEVPVTGRGYGTTLGVRVVDARPREALGRRASDGSGLDVFTREDLPAVWGRIVDGALRAAGFASIPYQPNHDPSLTVWIKELNYDVSPGFFTKKAVTTAAVKAEASRGGRTHEMSFRTETETTVVFSSARGEVERALNEASSNVLDKLFTDSELMAFLATPDGEPARGAGSSSAVDDSLSPGP